MNKNARELKIQLICSGIKQKDIAIKSGVSEAAISMVIAGKTKSKRITKIIKEMLGGGR